MLTESACKLFNRKQKGQNRIAGYTGPVAQPESGCKGSTWISGFGKVSSPHRRKGLWILDLDLDI